MYTFCPFQSRVIPRITFLPNRHHVASSNIPSTLKVEVHAVVSTATLQGEVVQSTIRDRKSVNNKR